MSLSFPVARDLFDQQLAIQKRSPETVRGYRRDLEQIATILAEHLGAAVGELELEQLTGPNLREAFASFAQGRSAASVARARSSWSAFLDLLVADGHLDGNPIASVPKTKVPARTPSPITGWDEDALDRVISSAADGDRGGRHDWPERDLAIVALLLGTGARRSELVGLDIGDIEGRATDRVARVAGKGGKRRSIPIDDVLDTVLAEYLETRKQRFARWRPRRTDPLLVAPPPRRASAEELRVGGRRLTGNQLYYLLRQVLRAAGLGGAVDEGTLVHAFRHTYGTVLAAAGEPMPAIGIASYRPRSAGRGPRPGASRSPRAAGQHSVAGSGGVTRKSARTQQPHSR